MCHRILCTANAVYCAGKSGYRRILYNTNAFYCVDRWMLRPHLMLCTLYKASSVGCVHISSNSALILPLFFKRCHHPIYRWFEYFSFPTQIVGLGIEELKQPILAFQISALNTI